MKTLMNDTQLETLDQVRQFLEGTEAVSFQIESKRRTLSLATAYIGEVSLSATKQD
jgi:hypothetical protein